MKRGEPLKREKGKNSHFLSEAAAAEGSRGGSSWERRGKAWQV